jgi:hypothetical protein
MSFTSGLGASNGQYESSRLMLCIPYLLLKAPGEGLEPSSPEGHQLARHTVRQPYDLEADPF